MNTDKVGRVGGQEHATQEKRNKNEATESISECNCKEAHLSEGFECLSFLGEKRGSAKVENDGQVHDFIDQKRFLIEG